MNSMGYLQQNPWLNVANKALEQMRQFYAEYGLTPAARSRLRVMTTLIDQPHKQPEPEPPAEPVKPHQPNVGEVMGDLLSDMDGSYVAGKGGDA